MTKKNKIKKIFKETIYYIAYIILIFLMIKLVIISFQYINNSTLVIPFNITFIFIFSMFVIGLTNIITFIMGVLDKLLR